MQSKRVYSNWFAKQIKLSYVYISLEYDPTCIQCSMMFHFDCEIE